MENNQVQQLLVSKTASIKEAMQVIDRGSLGLAFIVDENKKLFGVVTDGDIRRSIVGGISIHKSVEVIANTKPITISQHASKEQILALSKEASAINRLPLEGSLKVPVIDADGVVVDIMFLFAENKSIEPLAVKKPLFHHAVKKVLITGGAGYLGSILCRRLLQEGYRVRVLDNLTYGDEGIKELYDNKNFEFLRGDVRNISQVMQAVKGMDAVIHLSAIVGDSASDIDSKETIEINYLSAKAVAEACKFNQINKFLFASTCSVYGASKTPAERLHEESTLNPVSLYAQTKLESEKGILSLADENFAPTIFRFATLFGVSPRMRFDLVVNVMTAHAMNNGKITVFGGDQWRPNLNVSDAAEACVAWVASSIEKTGGQIFNVGSDDQNVQIANIAKMVKNVIPGAAIEYNKTSVDQRDYNIAFAKISNVLNFKPKKTIEEGIWDIKKILENKTIENFSHHQYHNYGFLINNKNNPISSLGKNG